MPWQPAPRFADRDDIAVYPGHGEPPTDLSGVELYVVPYGDEENRGQGPAFHLLGRMPALRHVVALTAGYNQFAGRLAQGVRLSNGRGLHDATTAEHAVGLMLAMQRELPRWVHAQQRRRWDHAYTASLSGSRVGIVGVGGVGGAIAERLAPFGVDCVKFGRHRDPDRAVWPVSKLAATLGSLDILVLAVPLTDETRGLIGAAELAALPDGALTVNVARGPVLDTAAVIAEAKRLRFALDVTDPEPLPAGHPLWLSRNVLITPHIGGGAAAFRPMARAYIDRQIDCFLADEELDNLVPGFG